MIPAKTLSYSIGKTTIKPISMGAQSLFSHMRANIMIAMVGTALNKANTGSIKLYTVVDMLPSIPRTNAEIKEIKKLRRLLNKVAQIIVVKLLSLIIVIKLRVVFLIEGISTSLFTIFEAIAHNRVKTIIDPVIYFLLLHI
jgi:hypothetical protein